MRKQFKEKKGTMWSVILNRDGKPDQRILLSAPTAKEAQKRVQDSICAEGVEAQPAQAVLYAIAKAAMRFTEFTFVPKK